MSYNRYRKRDKSEINRKSEIGLGRVENYDSADISENVIHHVRDYLYTPLYLNINEDRNGSYGVVKFLESGHTMFITSLCKASGETKQIYDTLCGSLVYNKPADEDDITDCPVNFRLLGNYDKSPIFINSTVTVTVYKEKVTEDGPLQIVTYVGIGMDGLLPYGKHAVRSIGTNLHDYTLGAVDYIDNTSAYDIDDPYFLAQWVFSVSDQIGRDLLAVPLYSEALGHYVYAANGENYMSGAVDVATINKVPFCGVYGLTIDGQDARHITVPAKHEGPTLNEAGEHYWEVLKSYPYLKYSKTNTKYQTANDLSQKNSLADKGGLCYLSDFDDSEGQSMDAFMDTLGYWLNDNTKEENLSVSSVITVGILRRFWNILRPLLDSSVVINNYNNLLARIEALEAWMQTTNPDTPPPDPVEPETHEPTEVSRYVSLTLSKGRLSFSSPSGSVSDTVSPTGIIYQRMSNGTVNNLGNTSTLKYSWEYDDAPIEIRLGNKTLNGNYQEVGELDGSSLVTITLTSPSNTPSFNSRELKFFTKDSNSNFGQVTLYISYTNSNETTHGALIDTKHTNVYLNGNGTSVASYYPIGSTVYFNVSAEELINSQNTVHAYINQVVLRNGTLEKEERYPISIKRGTTPSPRFNILEASYQGQNFWNCTDSAMPAPGTQGYSREYDLYYNNGNDFFMRIVFTVSSLDSYLTLDPTSMTFGATDTAAQRVTVSSNYSILTPSPSQSWIHVTKVPTANNKYQVSVDNTATERGGKVVFRNQAGLSKSLTVTQTGAEKYIWALPPDSTNYYYPGNSWVGVHSRNELRFEFSVGSNVPFSIYRNGNHRETFSSPSGSCLVSVPLYLSEAIENTHKIEVISELGTITLTVKLEDQGQEEEDNPIVTLLSGDRIFHKENAFDILRTEQIIQVVCKDPDKLDLSVTDTDLLAKIYYIGDFNVNNGRKQALIHCYPKTVKVWNSDKEVSLIIKYKENQVEEIKFTIEETKSTVGTYFNVSSTIESFRKSDTNNTSIEITGFSMIGNLTLSAADQRSSILSISSQTATARGISYNKWTITIPKGEAPPSGTPWTLELKNTVGTESFTKYISIYESSDVYWDTGTTDFQLTAFGHLCIADGCEIMPIVYERRQMKSKIGTSANPPDPERPDNFFVPYIIHDLSKITIPATNYWLFEDGSLKYSTCVNCKQISQDTHNAIQINLEGVGDCFFSNSMDTDFYNQKSLSYTSTYGSEYIETYSGNSTLSRYVRLPNSKVTINPICIQLTSPRTYLTTNVAPRFFPIPPDWKITTQGLYTPSSSSEEIISADGYLTIPANLTSREDFYYYVDTKTNWGETSTVSQSGRYKVEFKWSEFTVISDEQNAQPFIPDDDEQSQPEIGSYLYDQQDGNNNGILQWSKIQLVRAIVDDQYQPKTSRYYYNSSGSPKTGLLTNKRLSNTDGVPKDSKILTDLNLTLNCASPEGFNGTSTAPGSYSELAFKNAKIYDLEHSEVWDSQTFSGWNNLQSKHRRATFLEDGIGYLPVSVCSTRDISVIVGMAGICEASSNDQASSLMFVPYVRVTANTASSGIAVSTNYLLVKYGQRFGLGFKNAKKASAILVESSYQLIRKVINPRNGYFEYNVKISSSGDISMGKYYVEVPSDGIPNLLLDDSSSNSYKTNGTLDFEITHEDFCNIISYHISTNNIDTERTDDLRDDPASQDWYFRGEKSGCDQEMKFLIPTYTYLRDLKVKVIQ